jgi:probable rRNA maturation factor
MIEINNLTSVLINNSFLKKVARIILNKEKRNNLELSVAFVNKDKIKELNKKYRGKDGATDVLSFNQLEFIDKKLKAKKMLGEIIICPQEVKKNATKFKMSFEEEIINCLIHGILHLIGYDHENFLKEAKLMERKQKYYFSKIFNKRQNG